MEVLHCCSYLVFSSAVSSFYIPPIVTPFQPTVSEWISELDDVVDWFQFGLHLDIPEHELLSLQHPDTHGKVFARPSQATYADVGVRMEVLTLWLIHATDVTWTSVVRALVGIKMEPLAWKIATKYGR